VNELKEQLRTDLNSAMRARDQVRMRTLRMALTSVTNEEVSGDAARELSDDEIVKVLTREAKKRREAADAFESAGRPDQAAAERAEGEVLAGYLPAQLTDDELTGLVSAAIAGTGAEGTPGMGKVMKALTPQVAGRADGARVAAEVRRQLAARLRVRRAAAAAAAAADGVAAAALLRRCLDGDHAVTQAPQFAARRWHREGV
jgi:uncharacterized protein